MTSNRCLVALAVLLLSLFVVSIETEAKVLSNHNKRGVTNPSVNHATLLRTNDAKDTNRRTSPKQKLKTLRNLSKACNCNCTMPQDFGGFGSCFSNCLYSFGVTREKAAGCFAICVGAGSGNPLAIAVCAACLGVGEWVAGYCGMRCVWSHAFAPDAGPVSRRHSQPRNKRVPNFVGA